MPSDQGAYCACAFRAHRALTYGNAHARTPPYRGVRIRRVRIRLEDS